jgi:SAM-dependent methyltransferase
MCRKELINAAYKESISITHRHMLAVLNTILLHEKSLSDRQDIKILDAGCGSGIMIYFLNKYLPLFNTKKNFLIYGYDLIDHGVQEADYAKRTFSYLHENVPEINWSDRIKLIKSTDDWPFESEFFDFVISNQVLEHVWDHHQFFKEQNRVLLSAGFAHHIFPVKEVIIDGHVFLPGVHKLKSWDAIYRKVKFYSRIGLGVFKKEKKLYGNDMDYFSKVWADKIYHFCNYQTYGELCKAAKNNHLCITTRFTFQYYFRKFKELLGRKPDLIYKHKASSKIIFFFLKYISGISIVLYKGEYSKY